MLMVGGCVRMCVCGKVREEEMRIFQGLVFLSDRRAEMWPERCRNFYFFFVIGPEVPAGHRDSATPHQLAVRKLNLGVKEINKRSHTHTPTKYSAAFIIMTSTCAALVHHYPFSKFSSCLALICSNPL